VRDAQSALRRAFRESGDYCPPSNGAADGGGGPSSLCDLSLELSREARGVQVWLPLRAYGVSAFASHLDWCLDGARWIADAVAERASSLRVVAPPTLSVVNLALERHSSPSPRTDVSRPLVSGSELHGWLAMEVNARGRVLVAPTSVCGEACLRVCVLSCATSPDHLRMLCDDLLEAEATVVAAASRLERARANPRRALGFLVPYRVELRPSRGLCVLASRCISEGEPVWRFEDGACLPVSEESLAELAARISKAELGDYLNHCYPWGGQLWYPQGDTQFFNTSHSPAIRPGGDGVTWVATRPIAEGEEITDDYSTYDNEGGHHLWYERLCEKHGVDSAREAARKYNGS
jgi:hypothetical protein